MKTVTSVIRNKTEKLLHGCMLVSLLMGAVHVYAQNITGGVSIAEGNTAPHESAMLHVYNTTGGNHKGMIIPRMTESDRGSISPLTDGLTVYQTDNDKGYWFYKEDIANPPGAWKRLGEALWTLHSNGNDVYRATGNVGIGTDEPTDRLHVKPQMLIEGSGANTGGEPQIFFQNLDVLPVSGYTLVYGPTKGRLTYHVGYLHQENGGPQQIGQSARFLFNASLDVYGNVYLTSDSTLKKNISPLSNSLNNILSLNGVSFNWKDATMTQETQMGIIAQELETVYPELVTVTNFSEDQDSEEDLKTVNYDGLIPALIEAIKEQQVIIEGLKARVEALENP